MGSQYMWPVHGGLKHPWSFHMEVVLVYYCDDSVVMHGSSGWEFEAGLKCFIPRAHPVPAAPQVSGSSALGSSAPPVWSCHGLTAWLQWPLHTFHAPIKMAQCSAKQEAHYLFRENKILHLTEASIQHLVLLSQSVSGNLNLKESLFNSTRFLIIIICTLHMMTCWQF